MNLLREMQAFMSLTHPNIVRCYNWWLEKNEPNNGRFKAFIQMEYIGDYIEGAINLCKYYFRVLEKLKDSAENIFKKRILIFKIFV